MCIIKEKRVKKMLELSRESNCDNSQQRNSMPASVGDGEENISEDNNSIIRPN